MMISMKKLLKFSGTRLNKNAGLIFFLLVIGVINTAWPQAAWYLETGWKIKDAEPSDAALGWNRGVGIILLVIAAVLWIYRKFTQR